MITDRANRRRWGSSQARKYYRQARLLALAVVECERVRIKIEGVKNDGKVEGQKAR